VCQQTCLEWLPSREVSGAAGAAAAPARAAAHEGSRRTCPRAVAAEALSWHAMTAHHISCHTRPGREGVNIRPGASAQKLLKGDVAKAAVKAIASTVTNQRCVITFV